MKNQFGTLFQKYQEGQLSLKEEFLLARMISDPSNTEVDRYIKNDFQEELKNTVSEKKEMQHILHAIHHRLNLKQSEKRKSKVFRIYQWTSRIAAILFVPFFIISIYLFMNQHIKQEQATRLQIIAPESSRVSFELPDGTKGILNGGSVLDYSSAFAENRHVKLSGEAYFDVAHDMKHLFTIDANNDKIQVVGTRFTLAAWPDDHQTELVLEEGKVMFHTGRKTYAVLPGQRIVEKNGNPELSEVETWKYTGWKDGRLIFRNDSMEELARRISHWYNVDIEFDKSSLKNYTFRGVFEDDPLEEVLRLLKITSPIDYKIEDRHINEDGSFSPQKVIITKK